MGLLTKILGLDRDTSAAPLPGRALLLDVRSPVEFAAGHVSGAVSLPLNVLTLNIGQVAPDKGAPIIVYCQSGGRSASARQQLLDMGYQEVINGGGLHVVAAELNRDIVR